MKLSRAGFSSFNGCSGVGVEVRSATSTTGNRRETKFIILSPSQKESCHTAHLSKDSSYRFHRKIFMESKKKNTLPEEKKIYILKKQMVQMLVQKLQVRKAKKTLIKA